MEAATDLNITIKVLTGENHEVIIFAPEGKILKIFLLLHLANCGERGLWEVLADFACYSAYLFVCVCFWREKVLLVYEEGLC